MTARAAVVRPRHAVRRLAAGTDQACRRPARAAVLLLAVAVAVAACTDDGPAPPAPSPTAPSPTVADDPSEGGDRVAVIVAPPSDVSPAESTALVAAARGLADDPPDGVVELRVVEADDRQFTADLVELFVDRGFDVVCVVGTGAAALALDAARRHRGTRVCATDPAVEGGPINVVAATVDPGALVTAAAAAVSPVPPPVGLVVAPSVGSVEVVEPLLTSLLPEPPPPPAPTPTPSDPADDGASPAPTDGEQQTASPSPVEPTRAVVAVSTEVGRAEAAATVVDAGASFAVLLVPDSAEDVDQLRRGGVRTVVVADWVVAEDGVLPGGVLVGLVVDRAAELVAAIGAARTPSSPQVSFLRAADGVVAVVPGPAPGAGAAVGRVQAALDAAADG